MIYYEVSDIKTYKRKTKNEFKRFNQVNLGYESEFIKGEDIAVVRLKDFNNLINSVEKSEDITAEVEKLTEKVEKLENEKEVLNREIKNLNNDLKKELDFRSRLIFSYERVISDIQEKRLIKLFNMKLPESYKLLDELKNGDGEKWNINM